MATNTNATVNSSLVSSVTSQLTPIMGSPPSSSSSASVGGAGAIISSSASSMAVSSAVSHKSRFPRLQECAHFHYEVSTVDLPKNFKVTVCQENESSTNNEPGSMVNSASSGPNLTGSNSSKPNVNSNSSSGSSTTTTTNSSAAHVLSTVNTPLLSSCSSSSSVDNHLFHLQVTSNDKRWIIYRSYENFRYLDKYLHDCIFDRKFSCLEEPPASVNCLLASEPASSSSSKHSMRNNKADLIKHIKLYMSVYFNRFSEISFVNPINCGPILNWFEIDNKGNRMFAIDDSPINIPGVAAAVVKKRYVAQSLDELSLDVGNMISVIDMPPQDESVWWRGKKELEVGFFPSDCVELIKCNQHLSSNVTEHLPKLNQNQSGRKKVRLKHGKLITLLRSFFNTRPARNQLQSKGILKQRVFACDLGEHLSNTQQDVPKILRICTQFIEKYGIVDGIYRHTGLQSNIQKLRNAFDEEKFNEIEQEVYINDVHSVSSLLKMYFRELPNPLLTYQLYQKFISIAESLMRSVNVEDKIIEIHDVVQQLPPPHYRTLSFLMKHLHKLAEYSSETNMNTKNLAIVWAPNLLKSKEMDSKECMQYDMLHSITLQANISEFLIANADTIFNDKFASLVRKPDVKNNIAKTYRPISICYNNGPTKLLSLEEAQDKYKQVGPAEIPKYHTVIEIPELKKKKSKDKDKDKEKDKDKKAAAAAAAAAATATPGVGGTNLPANIHIQQQFELLQQQKQLVEQIQQQKTAAASTLQTPTGIPTSTSSQSVVSSAQNVMTTSSISNSGSSSPAFKSLFRNLRVGSLKHQSPTSAAAAAVGTNHSHEPGNTTSLMPTSLSYKSSGEHDQHKQQPGSPVLNLVNLNSTNLSRTASTTTFKPVSSTVGITNESKNDFSNCINQLQSINNAANHVQQQQQLHHQSASLSHQPTTPSVNITSFTGSLSPPTSVHANPPMAHNTSSSTAPILMRNSKLNQSQTSIHSNIVSSQSAIGSQTPILGTFKDPNSPNVNDRKLGDKNPIPSKRRTIQGQNVMTSSNSSIQLSSFNKGQINQHSQSQQQQQQQLPHQQSKSNQQASTVAHHAHAPMRGEDRVDYENEYDELVDQKNENNKENRLNELPANRLVSSSMSSIVINGQHQQQQQQQQPMTNTSPTATSPMSQPLNSSNNSGNRKSANDDEMQRIVAYINQFEKENITNVQSSATVVVKVAKSEQQLETLPNQECSPVDVPNNPAANSQNIGSIGEMQSIDEPSKLRLSSSSLSSSADSYLNEPTPVAPINEEDYDEHNNHHHHHHHYEDIRPEHNADSPRSQVIDRRTYIINKLYDNLENEQQNEHAAPPPLEQEDDNQYEKVILHKNKQPSVVSNTDDGDYDNDLLLTKTSADPGSDKNVIMIVNRTSLTAKQSPVDDTHIYVNVNQLNVRTQPETKCSNSSPQEDELIRESLGFEVAHLKQDENETINANEAIDDDQQSPLQLNGDANFDTELVELNNQIKNLLNSKTTGGGGEDDDTLEPTTPTINNNNKSSNPAVPPTKPVVSFRSKSSIATCNNVNVVGPSAIVDKPQHMNKSTSNGDLGHVWPNENLNDDSRHHKPAVRMSNSNGVEYEMNQTENETSPNSEILQSKRKSSVCVDELKRRRSETNEHLTTNNGGDCVPAQPQQQQQQKVQPKTRQSLTSNKQAPAPPSAHETNMKTSMSKSLQDNSKLLNSPTAKLSLPEAGHKPAKLVIIETNEPKPLTDSSSTENVIDESADGQKEKTSVKSKIKLMESIVQSRIGRDKNERSSSTSSSSSSSSSRSPPISPKSGAQFLTTTTNPNNLTPNVRTSSNVNKTVSNKLEQQASLSHESDDSIDSQLNGEHQHLPLCSLKEKRRTVKELMSKFEPK